MIDLLLSRATSLHSRLRKPLGCVFHGDFDLLDTYDIALDWFLIVGIRVVSPIFSSMQASTKYAGAP